MARCEGLFLGNEEHSILITGPQGRSDSRILFIISRFNWVSCFMIFSRSQLAIDRALYLMVMPEGRMRKLKKI